MTVQISHGKLSLMDPLWINGFIMKLETTKNTFHFEKNTCAGLTRLTQRKGISPKGPAPLKTAVKGLQRRKKP